MSRVALPGNRVGNDFVLPQQQFAQPAPSAAAPLPVASFSTAHTPLSQPYQSPDFVPQSALPDHQTPFQTIRSLFNEHSLLVFLILLFAISGLGVKVAANYYTAAAARHEASLAKTLPYSSRQIAGLNTSVPHQNIDAKISTLTAQPIILKIDAQEVKVSPETIKSWLKVTPNATSNQDTIHVDTAAVSKSLTSLTEKYVKEPVNQIAFSHSDGTSAVLSPGVDGTKVADPDGIIKQSQQLAKTMLGGTGFQVTTSTTKAPFQSVIPATFAKLIEVNVTTKQMYLYENGTVVKTYPISAGKPSTPTPIGQFHILQKLAVQDMRGYNPNGSQYFQPHVHWINYFKEGGYAIHGVYWHPDSWFGANNSSHGCVGLPDAQAEEVFNWAPVGTTIITHA